MNPESGRSGATAAAGAPGAASKPPARVSVTWQGGQRFDAGRPGGPVLRLDGRGETGQSPVDALLSALASCVAIDVVDILAKRRTPVERLEADIVGERADGTPRRIVGVTMTFVVDGAGVEREHAERAIDLALTKYCSVRDSLATDIAIRWSLTLNDVAGESRG